MRALAMVMLALWLWEALLLMAVMSVSQGQHHVVVPRRLSVIRDLLHPLPRLVSVAQHQRRSVAAARSSLARDSVVRGGFAQTVSEAVVAVVVVAQGKEVCPRSSHHSQD